MTVEEINNHRLKLTSKQRIQVQELARIVSLLEEAYESPFLVTSGVRDIELQKIINPHNMNSAHLTGDAVDVSDVDGKIYSFCISNVDLMIKLGLWFEMRTYCPRWTHMQTRPAQRRFFVP